MMKLYTNGRCKVQVNTDGSIKVGAGNWLSKYSAAINNDFWYIYEYGRKGATVAQSTWERFSDPSAAYPAVTSPP